MQEIILVRPGATDYDLQGRIQGTIDIPLSEDGQHQVEASASEIVAQSLQAEAPSAVYASPNQSAEQTAALIADALDLKPRTLERLTNLNQGLWQGMLVDDVRSKQPKVYRQWQEQPETVCPPEGETVMAAMQRVAIVLKKLLKKHREDEVIVLVTPEPLASVVRHVVRQDALGDLWKGSKECGQWESIAVPPEVVGAT